MLRPSLKTGVKPQLQSSHWNSSVKKVVLRNFANFTGKHLGWSLFLIELRYYWYCYNQKQSSGAALQKRCSYKFCKKIHKKTPKKKDPAQMFSCEFCKIPHNILKTLSDGCFSINFRFVYCPPWPFAFSKIMSHIFSGWVIFLVYCSLGTRVNSIFQALIRKPIFNWVEHLRWSFLCENSLQLKTILKAVLQKKLHCDLRQVLNTPP